MTDHGAFVPADFNPPTQLSAGELRLEPLGPEHNERDYAAWTSSMDHIRSSPGYGTDKEWPRDMSLDDNRRDLERHADDFRTRKGFTYTVLDADDVVVGCVYVYPAKDDVHDALVQSWVRESEAEHDLDLRQAVADWLTGEAWPFTRPLYEPLLS